MFSQNLVTCLLVFCFAIVNIDAKLQARASDDLYCHGAFGDILNDDRECYNFTGRRSLDVSLIFLMSKAGNLTLDVT
jgi:hypothetical protein